MLMINALWNRATTVEIYDVIQIFTQTPNYEYAQWVIETLMSTKSQNYVDECLVSPKWAVAHIDDLIVQLNLQYGAQ